jgi:hypothetical protein
MSELSYQRTVVAYHGCDESVVTGILVRGEVLKASANDYDWLGQGVYFWEHGPKRALDWAHWRAKIFGNIRQPAVLGAYVNFGNCFDLLDTNYTHLLATMFPIYVAACAANGIPVPQNLPARGETNKDLVLRYLDCAVLNWCLDFLEKEQGQHFHTVRCVFSEGLPAFEGSKIMARSHIQVAVRDTSAIVGFFKPNVDNLVE